MRITEKVDADNVIIDTGKSVEMVAWVKAAALILRIVSREWSSEIELVAIGFCTGNINEL